MVSSQPRKQRKRLASASWSERRKFLTAPLSKELQRQYGIKRLTVRKGDTVLVMRGDYKGIRGKVLTVSYAKERITVENASSKKANGEVIYRSIHASKVMIVELDTSDKRRMSAIEKRRKSLPSAGGEEVVVQQGGSS
ncbi:50S ribosomal protein L24 [Thermocladium modestius]|nr:50S ribosomal protein L24 [Thermocladium modestius]